MEKYSVIFIFAAIVCILIVFFLLLFLPLKLKQLSPSPEECKIILQNEGDNKVEIVFMTDNVPEDKVQNYVNSFLNSEPFASNKEKFNFYYAGEAVCKLIEGDFLFCYSKELLINSSICRNDYVVVLSDRPSGIRSTSYMNVMSLNTKQPSSVLLHEFGHAFANLADEYVPSVIPRGAKNCQKSCEKFEVMDGCFPGCSLADYIRSSENSVMRTLATSDYKKLNTKLIEEDLNKYE